MASRLLFLCPLRSSRALLAASILEALAHGRYDVWSTPADDARELPLVEQVLLEQGIPLLSPGRLIRPAPGMHWDEGVVLCSGVAAT